MEPQMNADKNTENYLRSSVVSLSSSLFCVLCERTVVGVVPDPDDLSASGTRPTTVVLALRP